MKIQEVINQCDKQIEMLGEDAQVAFVMPGKWGKKDTKSMYPGGPVGRIVNQFEDGSPYGYKGPAVYVSFSAKEVKQAMLNDGQDF